LRIVDDAVERGEDGGERGKKCAGEEGSKHGKSAEWGALGKVHDGVSLSRSLGSDDWGFAHKETGAVL